MYHVVNALADLPVLSARAGSIATTRGGKSNLDQRIPNRTAAPSAADNVDPIRRVAGLVTPSNDGTDGHDPQNTRMSVL